jgi:hypothetical protein
MKEGTFDTVKIRLTSSAESIREALRPYTSWIEEMVGVPFSESLILECFSNPGDAVAEELLHGVTIASESAEQCLAEAYRGLDVSTRGKCSNGCGPPTRAPAQL